MKTLLDISYRTLVLQSINIGRFGSPFLMASCSGSACAANKTAIGTNTQNQQ